MNELQSQTRSTPDNDNNNFDQLFEWLESRHPRIYSAFDSFSHSVGRVLGKFNVYDLQEGLNQGMDSLIRSLATHFPETQSALERTSIRIGNILGKKGDE